MSLTLTSNFKEVFRQIGAELKSLSDDNGADKDKMMRMVASEMVTVLHERIHVNGLNTAGQEFGVYSNAYLKRRQKAGLSGNKIILRFEGQLEKLTIVAGQNGNYSLGWISGNNLEKAKWMEERYGKIYDFSQAEEDHAVAVAEDYITQLLK